MTLYHCWKWLVTIYIIQILFFLYCSGLAVTSTPDPFHKDIKNDDIVKPKNSTTTSKGGNEGGSTPLSMAMESVLTFISVFVVGCVITLSVYSWKKFKPTSWRLIYVLLFHSKKQNYFDYFFSSRMPVPYQYSVLSQFENDPDDESVDPEHCLNMMAEDTSSEDDEINVTTETTGKTIGAIDLNEPPKANEVHT